VAGRQLAHSLQRCRRAGEEAEPQVRVDRLKIELVRDRPRGQDALELRREQELVASNGVVQRLDPQSVAHEHGTPIPVVPESDGEHSPQQAGKLHVVLLVQVGQDLRVASAAEPVSSSRQAVAELVMVEELAVLDRPDGSVFVRKRLVPTFDVDDAEPAGGDGHSCGTVDAVVVGAAVHHRVRHALERAVPEQWTRLTRELNRAADPAHLSPARP
jgi:hypothetical protein